jgi:hypothetical protein
MADNQQFKTSRFAVTQSAADAPGKLNDYESALIRLMGLTVDEDYDPAFSIDPAFTDEVIVKRDMSIGEPGDGFGLEVSGQLTVNGGSNLIGGFRFGPTGDFITSIPNSLVDLDDCPAALGSDGEVLGMNGGSLEFIPQATLSLEDNSVYNRHLTDACVDTAELQSDAVTTDILADLSVTTAKIASISVTTAKIADAAVTQAKIGDGAVGFGNLEDDAVAGAKLADSAVATAKIEDDAVTGAKIADGVIGTDKLANSAVTAAKILNGTIGTAKLADEAVTGAKIADGAINGDHIQTQSITNQMTVGGQGTFTTVDGKTVTVFGGLITSIV